MNHLQSYDKNRKRIGILVKATEITRVRRLNADYTLTFKVPMTSTDYRDKLPLKGYVKDERGQYYVINGKQRTREGKKLTAIVTCTHVMFSLGDIKLPYSSYIKEAYGIPISRLTDAITTATGGRFLFSIDDTFPLYDVKDWGRTNCLTALNDAIRMYGAEVEPDNYVIHLRKKIGQDNGFQYRLGRNIVASTFKDDSASLCTRLYATMKDDRTWIGQPASILTTDERARLERIPGAIVNGLLAVNYLISPYAALWANDTVDFYDDEIQEQSVTDPQKLLESARKALVDREMPLLETTINAADLWKLDKAEPKPGLGDIVTLHDPGIELVRIQARISELTEYPYARDQHAQVTVTNVMRRDFTQIIADLERSKRTIENMFSGGQIRTEVFEASAKQAITDITNSKTELIYPESGGILAQEKGNPRNQVRFTAGGIGISSDGWQTVRSAITARGVLAEQVVGQLGNFVTMEIGAGNNITKINTQGISAGHANMESAPFRVYMNGDVVARSIRLTGQIDNSEIYSSLIQASRIVGNEIEGGTITGALLRTAAYGRRVEIDQSGLRSYDSGGLARIRINTGSDSGIAAITFYGAGGGFTGELNSYQNSGLTVFSDNLTLGSNNTANPIWLQGAPTVAGPASFNSTVYFRSSVSGLQIDVRDVNGLSARLDAIWNAINAKAPMSHVHAYSVPNHNHGNSANQNFGGNYTTGTAA